MRMKFTDEEIELIINLYKNGMTCAEIWRRHFTHLYKSSAMVERVIRRNGLSRGHYKKEVIINHDYFDEISDEYKAYFLGFIMADGSISNANGKNKKKLQISINAEDREILDVFLEKIESDKSVKIYRRGNRSMAYVCIHSNKIYHDLQKYNVLENKTKLDVHIPKNISDEMLRHYIRGYFDGDGSVSKYIPKDQKLSRLRISICCTNNFAKDLVDILHKNGVIKNVVKSNIIDMEKYGINIKHVRITSMNDIADFYKYIYEDSHIYLKRKKSIFDEVLKERGLEII